MGNRSKHIEESAIFVLFKATDTKENAQQKIRHSVLIKNPNTFMQF